MKAYNVTELKRDRQNDSPSPTVFDFLLSLHPANSSGLLQSQIISLGGVQSDEELIS